jgi:ACR3 family arsenite efflux pump ArsB
VFTIVMLFALQGGRNTAEPLDGAPVALPLLVYFVVMFGLSFALGRGLGLGYARTASLASRWRRTTRARRRGCGRQICVGHEDLAP